MIGVQFIDTGYASQHDLHWTWLVNELIQNASRNLYLSAHMVDSSFRFGYIIIKYEFILKFYSPVLPLLFTSILRNQHIFFSNSTG